MWMQAMIGIPRQSWLKRKVDLNPWVDEIVKSVMSYQSANFDKVWKSGNTKIAPSNWIDPTKPLRRKSNLRMPVLNDVGTIEFSRRYDGYSQLCLYIELSTDLRASSESKYELLCQTTSGLINLGFVDFDNYKSKCAEISGIIALPTEQYLVQDSSTLSRYFWTGIERTGPFQGNFTATQNLPVDSACNGLSYSRFNADVYAISVEDETVAPTLDYVFTLRNEYEVKASCVCTKR